MSPNIDGVPLTDSDSESSSDLTEPPSPGFKTSSFERPPPPPYPPPPDLNYDQLRNNGVICPRFALDSLKAHRNPSIRFSHFRQIENGKTSGCPISRLLWQGTSQIHEQTPLLDLTGELVIRWDRLQIRPMTLKIGRLPVEESGLSQWSTALEFYNSEAPHGTSYLSLLGSANNISANSDSEDCFNTLRDWLRDCTEGHPYCSRMRGKPLPTRVIDVGDSTKEPKLHISGENEIKEYIALSYCWGASATITTSRETLESSCQAMPLTTLPKTQQDAIIITRRLGVRYLWIDSLCIIQDDDTDWQFESSRMASIYQHAYLTIAATRSPDAAGGCFSQRPLITKEIEVTDPQDPTKHTGVLVRIQQDHLVLASNAASTPPENWNLYPLQNRAWAFQEHHLSNRIVHYAHNELIWECSTLSRCECKHLDLFSYAVKSWIQPTRRRGAWEAAKCWENIVKEYSHRKLTKDSDRLPALSGMAHELAKCELGAYKAGLWDRFLWRQLAWQVRGGSGRRSLAKGTPTWSWASVENAYITYSANHRLMQDVERCSAILECECTLAGLDPMGQVSSGLLKMSWTLIPAGVTYAKASEASNQGPPVNSRRPNIATVVKSSQTKDNELRPCLQLYDRSDTSPYLGLEPDLPQNREIFQEGQSVYWLPMFWEGLGVEGLVLRTAIAGEDLFERIGYFTYWERDRFQPILQDWSQRTICIV